MVNQYYKLPIQFESLMQRNMDLSTCDLKRSIAQNIYMIITSKYREHRFDESYGCELWDMDFEVIPNENTWLDRIRRSIAIATIRHETRLDEVHVDVSIGQDEQLYSLKNTKAVKKRLTIYVNATLKQTGEPFTFTTVIYLSPMSLD